MSNLSPIPADRSDATLKDLGYRKDNVIEMRPKFRPSDKMVEGVLKSLKRRHTPAMVSELAASLDVSVRAVGLTLKHLEWLGLVSSKKLRQNVVGWSAVKIEKSPQQIFDEMTQDQRNAFLESLPEGQRFKFLGKPKKVMPLSPKYTVNFYSDARAKESKAINDGVLKVLNKGDKTIQEIALDLNLTVSKVRPALDRLSRDGKVEKVGVAAGRSGGKLNVWAAVLKSGAGEKQ